MTVQPAHHLVLINGYTHNGPWYEGDSYLSYRDPYAITEYWRNYFNNEILDVTSELWKDYYTECWRNYFNNEILDVTSELWKDYYFMRNTGRIIVFTTRPYF